MYLISFPNVLNIKLKKFVLSTFPVNAELKIWFISIPDKFSCVYCLDISIKFDIPYTKSNDIKVFKMDNIISNYEQYQEVGDSRVIQISIDL